MIAHNSPPLPEKQARLRSSEAALRKALRAAREEGLSVERLCITGGQYEIHFAGIEPKSAAPNDEGLKEW